MVLDDYREKVQKKIKDNNKNCVDCNDGNPRWVSLKYGCFICLTCAGQHRSMGVKYDQIKSISLDKWSKVDYLVLKYGGNVKFLDFLKNTERHFKTISEKYKHPEIMDYSKLLMQLIEEKEGIVIEPAVGYGFTNTNRSTINNSQTNTTSFESVGNSNKQRSYSNDNSYYSSDITDTSNFIKDKANYIKTKISSFTPELSSIGSMTINKANEISQAIYQSTKVIGSKTLESTTQMGYKLMDQAKGVVEKIKTKNVYPDYKKDKKTDKKKYNNKNDSSLYNQPQNQKRNEDWS